MWSGLYNALLFAAALFAVPYYGARMLLTGKYRKSLGPKFGRLAPETASRLAGESADLGPCRLGRRGDGGRPDRDGAPLPLPRGLHRPFDEHGDGPGDGPETRSRRERPHLLSPRHPLRRPEGDRPGPDPDLFVPVETELWPNFIRICRERGTRIVMANGRISPRSFRRYRATRFFWKEILAAARRGRRDLRRPMRRGSRPSGCPPSGFMSSGMPSTTASRPGSPRELEGEIAGRLGIAPGEGVLVAGSTHEGEEAVILEVYRRLLETQAGLQTDPHPPPHRAGSGRRGADPPGRICRLHPDVGDPGRPEPPGGAGHPRRCDRRALQGLQPRHRRLLRGEPRPEGGPEHPRGRRLGKGRLPRAAHGGFPG